tara:strand:- start:23099 stop:24352 length:1254 start_codon:yes stop_codon:yes gene_type:complete
MANYTIDITTNYESETTNYNVVLSSNSETMVSGDNLYFRWVSHTGGSQPASVSVSGFSSTAFTSTTAITLSAANSVAQFRTVKNPPTQQADIITVSGSSGGSKNFTANVSSGIDDVPNAFSLGADKTLANPNSVYSAPYVKIEGVTPATAITISATGGAETSVDGINYSTANKVGYLDDAVYLRMSAGNYGVTKSTTLSLGATSDTWSIITRADPANGQKIYFGHASGDVKLSELALFFGVVNLIDDVKLSSYVKNNVLVPDISENNTIPAALPISLNQFRNAATSFYFDQYPDNRRMVQNTSNLGTNTYNFGLDLGTEWSMGFGAGMNEGSEYKVQFIERWLTGVNGIKTANTDVNFFGTGKETYSASNDGFVVQVTTSETVEKHYQGIVRLWAKNRYDPSVEIYGDFEYEFFFYS